jgi:hypothetical protein
VAPTHIEPIHRAGNDVELCVPIRVVAIDRLASVTARSDVVDGVGELDAQGAGHLVKIAESKAQLGASWGKRQDLTPNLPTW